MSKSGCEASRVLAMRLVYTILPEDLVDKERGIFLDIFVLYIVFSVLARRV
jgi:hypothetical protein